MRNLDELCTALHAPSTEEFTPIDLDQVMAAGGRLRRRRRLLAYGASAAAVAAIVLAVALPLRLWASPPPSLADAPASSPSVSQPAPGASEDPSSSQPWGEIVATGAHAACGEQVVWAQRVSTPRLPGVRFGLMAGCRSTSGGLRPLVATNETDGKDDAPGFHAVQAQMEIGGDTTGARAVVAQFGYYAGPAAKITAVQGGRSVVAHQAPWSVDPNIVIFWFDVFTAGGEPTGLAAFDAAGTALATGNATAGHG